MQSMNGSNWFIKIPIEIQVVFVHIQMFTQLYEVFFWACIPTAHALLFSLVSNKDTLVWHTLFSIRESRLFYASKEKSTNCRVQLKFNEHDIPWGDVIISILVQSTLSTSFLIDKLEIIETHHKGDIKHWLSQCKLRRLPRAGLRGIRYF